MTPLLKGWEFETEADVNHQTDGDRLADSQRRRSYTGTSYDKTRVLEIENRYSYPSLWHEEIRGSRCYLRLQRENLRSGQVTNGGLIDVDHSKRSWSTENQS